MSEESKRLYRSRTERMIAGVCGGLGNYLGLDPTVLRVISVLLTLVWPLTIPAYLVLMIVVPEEPLYKTDIIEETPEQEPETEIIEE